MSLIASSDLIVDNDDQSMRMMVQQSLVASNDRIIDNDDPSIVIVQYC